MAANGTELEQRVALIEKGLEQKPNQIREYSCCSCYGWILSIVVIGFEIFAGVICKFDTVLGRDVLICVI